MNILRQMPGGHIGFKQKITEISGRLGESPKMCFEMASISVMYQYF